MKKWQKKFFVNHPTAERFQVAENLTFQHSLINTRGCGNGYNNELKSKSVLEHVFHSSLEAQITFKGTGSRWWNEKEKKIFKKPETNFVILL